MSAIDGVPTDDLDDEALTVMARIATRLRMTEGQLYTAVILVLCVLLLSLTGLPTAERSPSVDPAVATLESSIPEEAP